MLFLHLYILVFIVKLVQIALFSIGLLLYLCFSWWWCSLVMKYIEINIPPPQLGCADVHQDVLQMFVIKLNFKLILLHISDFLQKIDLPSLFLW